MPLGEGYFYDRKKKRYITIFEHATDAVERPNVFKSHEVKHLNPVTDRDTIVIHVLKKGFIRVRDWRGRLGWQFWGNATEAIQTLRRYINRQGLGDSYIVTLTDFKTKKNLVCEVKFIKSKECVNYFTQP